QHGGDAVVHRLEDLLGRDEVNVGVDGASRGDQMLSSHYFGGRADDQFRIDTHHGIGIAGLADFHDAAVLDANVTLDNAPVVQDQRVGDDQIQRAVGSCAGGIA